MTGPDATASQSSSRVALVAHDQMKDKMVEWAMRNSETLKGVELYATGTTGARIEAETGLSITRLKSGPLGGDAQIGAMIAEGRLDTLIFFIDPLSALPHDVDVKSLLRLATLYDTVLAINEATASRVLGSSRGYEA